MMSVQQGYKKVNIQMKIYLSYSNQTKPSFTWHVEPLHWTRVTAVMRISRVIRDTKVMRMTRATSSISELTAVLVVVVLLIYRGSYGQTYRGSDKEHI